MTTHLTPYFQEPLQNLERIYDWLAHVKYTQASQVPILTGGVERKHQFAIQHQIAPKFNWASAIRTRDGLLIVAGHQIKLIDWPDINFLCGGVLVKQNNNVSILTWEGNTTISCMS